MKKKKKDLERAGVGSFDGHGTSYTSYINM